MTTIINSLEWQMYQVQVFSANNPTNDPDLSIKMTKEQYDEFKAQNPIRIEMRSGIVRTLQEDRVLIFHQNTQVFTVRYVTIESD